MFQDEYNRSVIFHGVNIVYKQDPYIPDTSKFDPQLSLTDEDINNLVKWGFNFVRLGVMWEAVERQPGVYDDNYLTQVNSLINRLGEKGIYTLVDAHQNVLARKICGEGMPDFYAADDMLSHTCDETIVPEVLELVGACKSMKDYGYGVDENGDYLISDCQKTNFATYYSSPESVSAFNNLYQNNFGLRDKFLAYWDKVSASFASNPYVIGYDPINEPFPSDYFKHPELVLVPGKFDKEILQPLYKDSFNVYQKYDQSKIMFFETPQFPDTFGVGGGKVFPAGFTELPGGSTLTNL